MAEITNKEIHWIKMMIANDEHTVKIQVRLPPPITPKHIDWKWLFYEGYVSDKEWFELCLIYGEDLDDDVLPKYTYDEIKEAIGFQKIEDNWKEEVRQKAIKNVGEDADEFAIENAMDFYRGPVLLTDFPIDKPTPVPKSGIKIKRKSLLYGYLYELCGDGINEEWCYQCVGA